VSRLADVLSAALLPVTKAQGSPPDSRGGWYPLVREPWTGAWQRNVSIDQNAVLAYDALFACLTLIAGDIAKLRVKLVAQADEKSDRWEEVANAAYSPVLRKPNRFQNRIQFIENWVISKLQRGNTYVLKERDNRGVVTSLYVLDPSRVVPLITPDGAVYYELRADNMAGLQQDRLMVPASEIIHDRFNCLFHPLVGVSPIYASGLAATQGLKIEENSVKLFGNAARPGGLLIAPGRIDKENADRLKAYWDTNYTGENTGKIAVLGDGMKFVSLSMNAVDAQLIEQLKWTAEVVCSTFHVPPYKIGVGTMPTYNNIQSLNVEYYSQCLQVLIESIELCLDEGLGIGRGVKAKGSGEIYGTEFDTESLLRMDSITQMDVLEKSKGKLTVNEQRGKLNRGPVEGGDTVYLQEQDHSLAWLAMRDAQPIEPAAPAPQNDNDEALSAASQRRWKRLEKRATKAKEG
jgi:HK97 family phage portal protein